MESTTCVSLHLICAIHYVGAWVSAISTQYTISAPCDGSARYVCYLLLVEASNICKSALMCLSCLVQSLQTGLTTSACKISRRSISRRLSSKYKSSLVTSRSLILTTLPCQYSRTMSLCSPSHGTTDAGKLLISTCLHAPPHWFVPAHVLPWSVQLTHLFGVWACAARMQYPE